MEKRMWKSKKVRYFAVLYMQEGVSKEKKKQAHSQESQANQSYHKREGDEEETDQREPK
jgi:hypothetical protein